VGPGTRVESVAPLGFSAFHDTPRTVQVVCMSDVEGMWMTPATAVEADQPLADLPSAQVVLHRQHALEVAIVEVRYAGGSGTLTAAQTLALRDRLATVGLELPSVQSVANQEVTFEVGADGPQSHVVNTDVGWQLASADGTSLVVITADMVRLQTAQYARWSETIIGPLTEVLTAAGDELTPSLVQRVGVRFINRFRDPDARTAAAWAGRIDDAVLGPVHHQLLGPKIRSSQSQLEIDLGPAQGAVVRHGAFPDAALQGAVSYLLDIDVFNNASTTPDAAAICAVATQLDRTAFSLFEQITTSALRATLDPIAAESPTRTADSTTDMTKDA